MPELSIGASVVKIDQGEVVFARLKNFLVFAHYLFLVVGDWKSAQGILGVWIMIWASFSSIGWYATIRKQFFHPGYRSDMATADRSCMTAVPGRTSNRRGNTSKKAWPSTWALKKTAMSEQFQKRLPLAREVRFGCVARACFAHRLCHASGPLPW